MTVVQLNGNSTGYITGGNFLETQTSNGRYYTLNLIDDSNGKFYVSGGNFVNFDPSNSSSENPNACFLADGYKVNQEEVTNEDGTTTRIIMLFLMNNI